MTKLASSLVTVVLIGSSIVLACGGESDSDAQASHAGGASNAGGASTAATVGGAVGAGGTNASAGATVGPTVHLSQCEDICASATTAGCSGGTSTCVMTCTTLTGFSGCQPQIDAWIQCAKTAQITCDTNGAPVFSGCDTQQALAAACAVTTPAPAVVQTSCSSYCEQIEAKGCSLSTPMGDCRQSCGLAGVVVATCQASFVTYLNCATSSGSSCDSTGQLDQSVCTSEQFAYASCVLSAMGGPMALTAAGGAAAM